MAKPKKPEPVAAPRQSDPGAPTRNFDWDAALEASYQREKREGERK